MRERAQPPLAPAVGRRQTFFRYPKQRLHVELIVAVPHDKHNPCILASIPMWIIAGRKDKVVSASQAEAFIELMKLCGAKPRYTLYDTNQVETAKRAYRSLELYKWMLSQSRGKSSQLHRVPQDPQEK